MAGPGLCDKAEFYCTFLFLGSWIRLSSFKPFFAKNTVSGFHRFDQMAQFSDECLGFSHSGFVKQASVSNFVLMKCDFE